MKTARAEQKHLAVRFERGHRALGQGLVSLEEGVLGGGTGFLAVLEHAVAESEDTALLGLHPGVKFADQIASRVLG